MDETIDDETIDDDIVDVESPIINDIRTIGEQHGGIWVEETFDYWPELRFPNVTMDGMYFLVMAIDATDWSDAYISIGWRKLHGAMYSHSGAGMDMSTDQVATPMEATGLNGETVLLILATIEENSDANKDG